MNFFQKQRAFALNEVDQTEKLLAELWSLTDLSDEDTRDVFHSALVDALARLTLARDAVHRCDGYADALNQSDK